MRFTVFRYDRCRPSLHQAIEYSIATVLIMRSEKYADGGVWSSYPVKEKSDAMVVTLI